VIDWAWIGRHTDDIWSATREHLVLTALPVLLGLLLAVPLGILATRTPRLATPVLAISGVLYTIPALAMFVFMIPFTGLTVTSAVIALTIYTLIVLVRATIDGLASVPRDVREAAEAMGYRPAARLLRVELPLALPVLIAGIRIATVSTIGLVAIGVIINVGGLGRLVYSLGFQRNFFMTPIWTGLALIVALSVVADLALIAVERRLTPWSRGR
jgi:osmoprotectant transport system permease protein